MAPQTETRWSPERRAAFRFLFVYAVLFLAPGIELIAEPLVPWVGKHLLGIDRVISTEHTGSGDRTFDWIFLLCVVVSTIVGGAVWCIVSRRARYDERLYAGLRIALRYVLALTMLGYGFAKVFLLQFQVPGPYRLVQTYGDSSPMGLLWTFMGSSPAYTMFTGFAETVGGVLLLSRRTTTLGALVVMGVMTNVVMLNFCYDVPVKIHSTHWLLIAVLLAAPDVRRLVDVLWFHRPTTAVQLRPPFATPRRRRMWLVAKSLVVTLMLGSAIVPSFMMWRQMRNGELEPDVYEVETFRKNGALHPPLVTDPERWRRLAISPSGFAATLMDGSKLRYKIERADDGVTLTISQPTGELAGTLVEALVDEEHTRLVGTLEGAELELEMRRIRDTGFLLTSRGFHWVNDVPFNR